MRRTTKLNKRVNYSREQVNDTDHEHRVHAGLEPTTFDQMDKHGADVPNQFSSYSLTFIFVKQHDIKLK